ncbi:hypothetical protein LEL_10576 [Akanthomyces lecanii RCEF 1005]|uniref:Uncharacterized protein n=1 Tax=Akanthomyces lecanii RCEF 1005 TaxID=1081108 RepID=A0A167XLP4_CORDF|nr:hypothetical protein LEL_10576 [Akanthomyces lecanii RCEF 1005]
MPQRTPALTAPVVKPTVVKVCFDVCGGSPFGVASRLELARLVGLGAVSTTSCDVGLAEWLSSPPDNVVEVLASVTSVEANDDFCECMAEELSSGTSWLVTLGKRLFEGPGSATDLVVLDISAGADKPVPFTTEMGVVSSGGISLWTLWLGALGTGLAEGETGFVTESTVPGVCVGSGKLICFFAEKGTVSDMPSAALLLLVAGFDMLHVVSVAAAWDGPVDLTDSDDPPDGITPGELPVRDVKAGPGNALVVEVF